MKPSFAAAACVVLAGLGWAQVTQRVSVHSSGAQGNDRSDFGAISANGRFVAFDSAATNLVVGDTNHANDVFVHDLWTGITERVSVTSTGMQAAGDSGYASISADGRYVAFISGASNLVPNDTNSSEDVFVHDRVTGVTTRASVDSNGVEANNTSASPSISPDGRFVAFSSEASNLVAGDSNGAIDVFVHDNQTGTTVLASVSSSGLHGDRDSREPSISEDGRYVAFQSFATNLVDGPYIGADIYVHDFVTAATTRVSVNSNGVPGSGSAPSISSDGRYVAFWSSGTNLVPNDTNNTYDVFVHDRQASTTIRVSVDSDGNQGNDQSFNPRISALGRYVAFESHATNLVPGDSNAAADVFIHDCQLGTTERVSVTSAGAEGNQASGASSVSEDGRFVAFTSLADNLVDGDTNGERDVFVRDRQTNDFTDLCQPGHAGVVPCPCMNAPSGADRGCDNSSSTGGASLSAIGLAHVSTDTLVLTTSGEKPTALSIVMQGNGSLSSGAIYGQGVRCVGGTIIRRLFTKQAVGGSISAPEFGAGDPSISYRSAEKGDPIQAGESRWYLVYYRDPVVLGGCPATATFNATQTGQISWWP